MVFGFQELLAMANGAGDSVWMVIWIAVWIGKLKKKIIIALISNIVNVHHML